MSIFMIRYMNIKGDDDSEDDILGTFLVDAADEN